MQETSRPIEGAAITIIEEYGLDEDDVPVVMKITDQAGRLIREEWAEVKSRGTFWKPVILTQPSNFAVSGPSAPGYASQNWKHLYGRTSSPRPSSRTIQSLRST